MIDLWSVKDWWLFSVCRSDRSLGASVRSRSRIFLPLVVSSIIWWILFSSMSLSRVEWERGFVSW